MTAKRTPSRPLSTVPLVTPRESMKLLDAELWLSERLGQFAQVFEGDTVPPDRRERIAEVIAFKGLDCAVAGKGPTGKSETFSDLFARLYGVTLKTVLSKLPKKE